MRFAREGACVVIVDVNQGGIQPTVDELKALGGDAIGFHVDVTRRTELAKLMDAIVEQQSRIDIHINNAGITRYRPFDTRNDEDWLTKTTSGYPGPLRSRRGEHLRNFNRNDDRGHPTSHSIRPRSVMRHFTDDFVGATRPASGADLVNASLMNAAHDDKLLGTVAARRMTVDEIKAAQKIFPVATVQNRYNLVDRADDEVLDYCEANGIGFIPWFPLAAGTLARPGGIVDTLAKAKGATPGQIALAWILKRSPVTLPIQVRAGSSISKRM